MWMLLYKAADSLFVDMNKVREGLKYQEKTMLQQILIFSGKSLAIKIQMANRCSLKASISALRR